MKAVKEFFSGKKVLITGGLGFIGSNLAHRLVQWDAEVLLVDSLIPEYGGNLRNIAEIEDRVKVNVADVRDEYSMKYLVQNQDYLFNLAGQTSHLDSMRNPYTDLEINCKSQLSILEACRKQNPSIRIVYASTRQIYGTPEYLPVDENHPIHPKDVNGINKMAGEAYHVLYANVYSMRTCALRLTNTYGPRMRVKDARQTFLGWWLRQVIAGEEIQVYGSGNQLRDLNYVDDVVDALILGATQDDAAGKVFNLGAPHISLKDLAALLIQVNGSGSYQVVPFPSELKSIDIGDYYGDFTLIYKTLGWKPSTDLHSGLTRTVKYFREHQGFYW